MPRSSSRSASKTSKTPSSVEKRVTRGSVRSPAAKSSAAAKSPAKSPAAVSSPKKSAVPAARSRSRATSSKSPKEQRGRSTSTKRKSSSPKSTKTKQSPGKKSASRGRSRQRKTKKDEDDEEEMSVDEEARAPVKRAAKGSRSKSKGKVVAAKSPARRRSQPKSSSPKAKRAPAASRRSRTSGKGEEEEAEEEEAEQGDKGEEEKEEEAKEEEEEEEEEASDEADDEAQAGAEAEPVDDSKPADDIKPADETAADRQDTVPSGHSLSQTAVASDADDLVCIEEDTPHVDRKRKFDEIEDESDDDDVKEVDAVSPAKVLKVCEVSDVKTASVEASLDGEMECSAEVGTDSGMTAESKFSLPLSSETNIEDDYVVITPDDVPPLDSDEVMDTVSKMVPSLPPAASSSCTNDTLDTVAVRNPLLHREFVSNAELHAGPPNTVRCFTLGSYNVLADYHAQRDYGHGMAPWLTPEHLSLSSRHQRLMEELAYLDEDVICLQEVGGDYMHDMLQPALESLGYKGVFIARNTMDFCEGEATFYRTSRFSLESSESLLLSDVISQALDESVELDDTTRVLLKESLSTHAVAMLTRLRSVTTDDVVTVANIHVSYDKFERPDRQCLQLAVTMQRLIELAGGLDKPHVICGDFNAWPTTSPYQLMSDGHLSDASFTDLQAVLTIDSGDSQLLPVVNFWSDGFQCPIGSAMKSAYGTVQGCEPVTSRYFGEARGVDYIWFSSVSLDVLGVLKAVDPQLMEAGLPSAMFPSDHVSIKASFAFK